MQKIVFSIVFLLLSLTLVPVSSAVWSTDVSFKMKDSPSKGKSSVSLFLCGTVKFTNPKKSPTIGSFFLSIRVCNGAIAAFHSIANDQDSITKAILNSANDEVSLLIGKNLNLKAGDTYDLGICFRATDMDGVDENDLKFGLDLSDNVNPSCTGADCVLSCGNGECSKDENKNSCPFDCLTSECTKTVKKQNKKKGIVDNQNVWPAKVIVQKISEKTEEICGKIYVSHDADLVALSHILTFGVQNDKAKIIDFSSFESAFIRDKKINIYRQVANGVSYKKGIYYTAASFCLVPKEGFDFNKDIRVGADMKDQASNCEPKECQVECGNDKCDKSENASNCAFDCK